MGIKTHYAQPAVASACPILAGLRVGPKKPQLVAPYKWPKEVGWGQGQAQRLTLLGMPFVCPRNKPRLATPRKRAKVVGWAKGRVGA